MASKTRPEQEPQIPSVFHSDLNEVRRELDEKLNGTRKELDDKIEKKLSNSNFFSVLGVLVIILLGVLGYFCAQIVSLKDKADTLQDRITVIETKLGIRH